MVTSRDVARLAGVSQATVSRVLSPTGSARISAATRDRVEAAMSELGYVPHVGAQAMKTQRTNVVGVVVEDLTNPFYPEVLEELTQVLDAAGYRVVIWNTGGDSHRDAVRAIGERAVDGVIFTTATGDSQELASALEQARPIVLVNRVVAGLDCDQVFSANEAGGSAVADYLLRHDRVRAAFIGGSPAASTSQDRATGFLERMAHAGSPVPERWRFAGPFSHDRSDQIAMDLFSAETRPDSVFCANDYIAFGVLDAMRRLHLTATDCWVIGYDDVDMAAWLSFDLTTVRQPSREMARAAGQLLVDRLRSPDAPAQRIEYPCQLIIRGSTEHHH